MTGAHLLLPLLLALTGGLGAVARFLADTALRARLRTALPVPTLMINATGSLLLGLAAGAAAGRAGAGALTGPGALKDPVLLAAALLAGFCGGFTTFSTAMVETVRLLRARRPGAAGAYLVGSAAIAWAAVVVGLTAGGALTAPSA